MKSFIVFLFIFFALFSGSHSSTGGGSGRGRRYRARKSWVKRGSNTADGLKQKRRFIDDRGPRDMDYYEDYFDDN
jgi:hypothetical protein